MRRWKAINAFASALLCFLAACDSSQSVSGKLVEYKVESAISLPEPQYSAWNISDELTRLYWQVPASSMLAQRNDNGQQVYNFRFRYRIYQNYSSRNPMDSGAVVMTDLLASDSENDMLSGEMNLKLATGINYMVEVSLFDMNRKAEVVELVDVLKSSATSSGFFEIHDPIEGLVFTNYTTQPGPHKVRYSKPLEQLWVRYYDREFPVASAPFTTVNPKPFDFTPDSLFILDKSTGGEFSLNVFSTGFYQLAPDSSKRLGATLFYHSSYYPKQQTVLDLIGPMRYITTNQEFQDLKVGDNLKQNVDEFWLRIGGSPDRTRKLIRSYFERVEYANRHFGSYVEGWKSDRGMCFVVFGQPDAVYRTTSSEKWIYGQSNRYNSLTLVFTKVMNPFSNNDFRLNRSSSLKSPWYRAVEFWRQGRVVNYK